MDPMNLEDLLGGSHSREDDASFSADELELAYQQALDSVAELNLEAPEWQPEVASDVDSAAVAVVSVAAAPVAVPVPTSEEPPPSLLQIVEACLFVSDVPLTARKLANAIRSDAEPAAVEQAIIALNAQYLAEQRAYEIRMQEGGYALGLLEEFEPVRDRVYGLGPREVKLPQEVLEVLALVAYQQPVTEAELEALGKPQPGGALRQLLRRDLIVLDRDPELPKTIRYRTTARFLSLFGIGSLADLPRPDDLAFR